MNEFDPNEATTTAPVTSIPPAVTPATADPAAATADPATAEPMTPTVYEAAPVWAPAEPVVKDQVPRGRGGRLRWAVALAVVALVVGASAVVAALIVGQSPQATVLGYVPDKTIVYGEVRLDLPGDQRRAVGEFLSKFPGFADQAALDGKIDEVLDQLVKDASNDKQSYTGDIKPWFDGELAFAVGPLPKASAILGDPSAMGSVRVLLLVSIKDPAGAQAWFDAGFTRMGVQTTTETYAGATLTSFGSTDGPKGAFAILDGKVAVIGDETSVKAAVDTGGHSGFANEPGPDAALGAADSDRIGFVYVALKPLFVWSNELNQATGSATGAMSDTMQGVLPEWGAYWLRVESDAVVMEAVAPQPAISTGPTKDRASKIVDRIPASAVVAVTANDYGASLKKTLDVYRSEPSLKVVLDQLDKAAGVLGGTDAALGWIGDTAIVVNVADGTPEAGLLVIPTDPADASRFFTSIRAFISLGGGQVGATVREETYNGTTITIVDAGKLADLAGASGLSPGLGMTLPEGRVEIAYAVTDDLVVVGSGPGFVKHVLDTTRDTSLGGNDRYNRLADRAGKGSSTVFVDIAAIRVLAEKAMADMAPSSVADYDKNVKPFLAPFDAMIASGSVSGDLTHSTFIITVK